MPRTTLVLLQGLDGTGNLFEKFVSAPTASLNARVVRYPTDRLLNYADLLPFVVDAIPQSEPFVLLAESFSTALAIRLAATNPTGLKGLVICASFIRNPAHGWLLCMKSLVQPWLFRIPPPRFAMEHFLIGAQAPDELRDEVRRTLRSVSPEVLAFRVQAVMTCDATEEFARIPVPMLYVQGEQDRLVSKSSFEEIKALKPDVILAVIDAPHFVLQREPHDAAEVVAHFVADLPS